jgi:hypothetical protein
MQGGRGYVISLRKFKEDYLISEISERFLEYKKIIFDLLSFLFLSRLYFKQEKKMFQILLQYVKIETKDSREGGGL